MTRKETVKGRRGRWVKKERRKVKRKGMKRVEKGGREMNKERRRQISVGCVDDLDRLV